MAVTLIGPRWKRQKRGDTRPEACGMCRPHISSGIFRRTRTHSISPEIRQMAKFEHVNLSDKKEIRKKRGFDFIFCRNVLIYFDDMSRKWLMDQFYVALNPGGYIFLGSSESVGRISTAFKIVRAGGDIVYYKE